MIKLYYEIMYSHLSYWLVILGHSYKSNINYIRVINALTSLKFR